jgi:hypothetical protein
MKKKNPTKKYPSQCYQLLEVLTQRQMLGMLASEGPWQSLIPTPLFYHGETEAQTNALGSSDK